MSFYDAEVAAGGVTQTLLEFTKTIMGITDNTQDAALSASLDIAGNAAELYIDNIIDQRDVTERFKDDKSPQQLRYWPVQTLVLVEVDGSDVTANRYSIVQDGLYWVLKSADGSCVDWTQMDITYTAGYDPIPEALAYAIAIGAAAYDQNVVTAAPLKKETVVGVGSMEYDTGLAVSTSYGSLPASSTSILDAYRRYHV